MNQFFNDHLGLQPGENEASVVLDTRPEHQVAPDIIHFAVLTTIAEVSAAMATAVPVVPSSINVQLLRRAVPGRLHGQGKLLRRGRRLAVAEGEVTQDGKLVAKATIQFAVMG